MVDLSEVELTLTFSAGVGLSTWRRIGSLERELALYRRMCQHLGAVRMLTYGGPLDALLARDLSPLQILPSLWTRIPALTESLAWMLHGSELRRSHIIKTNQIPGSQIAVELKRRTGARLMVRCGYLWSLNRSRETSDPGEVERAVRVEREAFEAADVGIVSTEANRKYVIERHGIDPAKLRVLPNYVDVARFVPRSANHPEPEVPRVGYVGRLAKEKNLSELVQAMAMLGADGFPNCELMVVGDGPLKRDLSRQCSESNVRVEFLGSMPHTELPRLLWECQVFVLPSLYEGHPKSLLEAMACGLPVVGSCVPGIREEIRDGETGLLCPPDAEAFASALRRMFSDEGLRERMGKAGAAHVQAHYALDHLVERELHIMRELIS